MDVDPRVKKLCNACLDYVAGKMTLKQVQFHARGQRIIQEIQRCPDLKLGFLLYELFFDFFTWYGDRDDLVDEKIRMIADHLQHDGRSEFIQ